MQRHLLPPLQFSTVKASRHLATRVAFNISHCQTCKGALARRRRSNEKTGMKKARGESLLCLVSLLSRLGPDERGERHGQSMDERRTDVEQGKGRTQPWP